MISGISNKSIVSFAFMALLMTGLSLWTGCNPSSQENQPDSILSMGKKQPGFVAIISGNWRSHIEPCGCTDKQRGGIDRRTDTILKLSPDQQSRLLLDSGPLILADDRQSQLKLEVFLRSFKTLGFDGISLTPMELVVWQENLGLSEEECPPIILTNLSEEGRSIYPVHPWITTTIHIDQRSMACLALSVCDPESVQDATLKEKVVLTDPVRAVQQALEEQSTSVNADDQLVVVMINSDTEGLPEQLATIDGVDLIVTQGYGDEPEPVTAGPVDGPLIFSMGIMGKYMAEVRLPVDHVGVVRAGQLSSVEIDSHNPRDPRIVKHMNNYQLALRAENLIANETLMPRLALNEENGFVGNTSCAYCHKEIFDKWSEFKHAHAMETLMKPEIDREFDPECVGCHTVAMRYDGGYISMAETPDLASVGCEACHGPGAKHVSESAAAMALRNKIPPYQTIFMACEVCHTHENSPEFEPNREAYFSKIRHWKKDERLYWK